MRRFEVIGIDGIAEVRPGDDVAGLVVEAATRQATPLRTGDVLVVGQKIVSKAEGRLLRLGDVAPSPVASSLAAELGRDARLVEVILRESRRIVRMDKGVLITETHHGWICANAGVDESNSGGPHTVVQGVFHLQRHCVVYVVGGGGGADYGGEGGD